MRRRRRLVVAILVLLLIVVLLLLRGCNHQHECMLNVEGLSKAWLSMSERQQREATKFRGSAMLLAWCKSGRIDAKVLRCPDDPDLRPLDDATRRAYDEVDLADPPDDLCSYAVRDFERYPLPADVRVNKEVIACCRCGRDGRTPHHRGDVVVVLWGAGDVQAMLPEQLGFAPGEPVVVGPDSKSEILKKLIQRAAK